jgi:hypothetical protein
MFFLVLIEIDLKSKKPASFLGRRALVILRSVWLMLDQAIAVRRHGIAMMVVMAVMAAGLHLHLTLSGNGTCCQLISVICAQLKFRSAPQESGILQRQARELQSNGPPQIAPVAANHAGD